MTDADTFWATVVWHGARLAVVAGVAWWIGAELNDAYQGFAAQLDILPRQILGTAHLP
jgi:hypothetical protein